MNRGQFLSALLLSSATLALPIGQASAQTHEPSREDARLITATQVLEELRATPDQHVPAWLLQRAYGVAVIPEVIKGAFMFGGRYGSGVLTVRDASGHFSNPVFIKLAGGSWGLQIGAASTDVVLVFVTPRSVEHFAHGKFTLGADASVAAGPVGRQGEAAAGVNAEIYSYSRTRGLFAGVALDGTVLAYDPGANHAYYDNDEASSDMITSGRVTPHSDSARRFLAAVVSSANGSAAPNPPVSTASNPTAPKPAPAAPSSGAQTFPMQDGHPGNEPR
jgi:lipid-binding SYLF domain-containing protein